MATAIIRRAPTSVPSSSSLAWPGCAHAAVAAWLDRHGSGVCAASRRCETPTMCRVRTQETSRALRLAENQMACAGSGFFSDEWMERFLRTRSALSITLPLRRAGGGQVWVRINGDYRASSTVRPCQSQSTRKANMLEGGERGKSTIISGAHRERSGVFFHR